MVRIVTRDPKAAWYGRRTGHTFWVKVSPIEVKGRATSIGLILGAETAATRLMTMRDALMITFVVTVACSTASCCCCCGCDFVRCWCVSITLRLLHVQYHIPVASVHFGFVEHT